VDFEARPNQARALAHPTHATAGDLTVPEAGTVVAHGQDDLTAGRLQAELSRA